MLYAVVKKYATSEGTESCITGLQRAGRYIGQRHYQMILDILDN